MFGRNTKGIKNENISLFKDQGSDKKGPNYLGNSLFKKTDWKVCLVNKYEWNYNGSNGKIILGNSGGTSRIKVWNM